MSIKLAFAMSAAALAATVAASPSAGPSRSTSVSRVYQVGGSHTTPYTVAIPKHNVPGTTLTQIRIDVGADRWWFDATFDNAGVDLKEGAAMRIGSASDIFDAGTATWDAPGEAIDIDLPIPPTVAAFSLPEGLTGPYRVEAFTGTAIISTLPDDVTPFVGEGSWSLVLTGDAKRVVVLTDKGLVTPHAQNLNRKGTVTVTYTFE